MMKLCDLVCWVPEGERMLYNLCGCLTAGEGCKHQPWVPGSRREFSQQPLMSSTSCLCQGKPFGSSWGTQRVPRQGRRECARSTQLEEDLPGWKHRLCCEIPLSAMVLKSVAFWNTVCLFFSVWLAGWQVLGSPSRLLSFEESSKS